MTKIILAPKANICNIIENLVILLFLFKLFAGQSVASRKYQYININIFEYSDVANKEKINYKYENVSKKHCTTNDLQKLRYMIATNTL